MCPLSLTSPYTPHARALTAASNPPHSLQKGESHTAEITSSFYVLRGLIRAFLQLGGAAVLSFKSPALNAMRPGAHSPAEPLQTRVGRWWAQRRLISYRNLIAGRAKQNLTPSPRPALHLPISPDAQDCDRRRDELPGQQLHDVQRWRISLLQLAVLWPALGLELLLALGRHERILHAKWRRFGRRLLDVHEQQWAAFHCQQVGVCSPSQSAVSLHTFITR